MPCGFNYAVIIIEVFLFYCFPLPTPKNSEIKVTVKLSGSKVVYYQLQFSDNITLPHVVVSTQRLIFILSVINPLHVNITYVSKKHLFKDLEM